MTDPNLITSCNFHGKEYLIKMNIINSCLELFITEKVTGEEWQCNYNQNYIENLTQKTGNFKQFSVFIAMLKSGLLKTSESVTLDLLTFEDLEVLRNKRLKVNSSRSASNNRRYLIVTYTVEFDRIHYPLPMEYHGPPDPIILQAHIRRLENEIQKLKSPRNHRIDSNEHRIVEDLQTRVEELTKENKMLRGEIQQLNRLLGNRPRNQVQMLQRAIISLEKSVLSERTSHHHLVEKLRNDKEKLNRELERVKKSETDLKLKFRKSSMCRNVLDAPETYYIKETTGHFSPPYRDKCLRPNYEYKNGFVDTVRRRSLSPKGDASFTKDGTPHRSRSIPLRNKIGNSTKSRSKSRDSSVSSDSRMDIPKLRLCSSRDRSPLSDRTTRQKSRSASRCSTASSDVRTWDAKANMKPKIIIDHNNVIEDEVDFKHLEGRIHALQKMLKDGFTLK